MRRSASIADLETLPNSINWTKYINGLTHPVACLNKTDEILRIKDHHYLSDAPKFLKKVPKRTIANYMIWRTILTSAGYVGGEIGKYYGEYRNKTIGKEKLSRFEQCIKLISDKESGLAVGVSSMYVRKFFKDETRRVLKPALTLIIEQFRDIIKNVCTVR